MKQVLIKILRWWPVITLTILVGILIVANYTPGTWYSGWDTLHPEFNFPLNIQRLLFGVFREDQGLGAVAAHSHMADLPRILLLLIFSTVLPLPMLRYAFFFLTLLVGPLGMYFFLKQVVFHDKSHGAFSSGVLASFLGATFYLLNLGTMQQYVVAFEMFNVLYALLPWLMLCATYYLERKNRSSKPLFLFAIVTIFSASMAYAATLWYVYFMLLAVYVGTYMFPSYRRYLRLPGRLGNSSALNHTELDRSNSRRAVRSMFVILAITLLLNAYWLFPNIYFILTHSKEVEQAYINKLFSPQAFLYNKEFGTLSSLALMKSFLFDWSVFTLHGFGSLLKPWIQHLSAPGVTLIGYLFAVISGAGLLFGMIKRRRAAIPLGISLLIVLFFLINENAPTGSLYAVILNHFPLFREGLRFPHSKFYLNYIFIFATGFGLGSFYLISLLKKIRIPKVIPALVYTAAMVSLLIYFMLPAFEGQFISPAMKIQIPDSYEKLFTFMNKQPEGRIANLPINSFWGWSYYDWYSSQRPSFQGAGFLWFGLKDPLLDRDFDRWSPFNEQYYEQMSYAVYNQSPALLRQTLAKFNISYILLDTSIIAPDNDPQTLFYPQITRLLANSNYIKKIAGFGENLTVYKVTLPGAAQTVSVAVNPPAIGPAAPNLQTDPAYSTYGTYIEAPHGKTAGTTYPFRNLINNENGLLNNTAQITQQGVLFPFVTLPQFKPQSYILDEKQITASTIVSQTKNALSLSLYPLQPYDPRPQTPPLTASLPLTNGDNDLYLAFNQSSVFHLQGLASDTPYSIGNVALSTSELNTISLYKNAPDLTVKPDFTTLSYSLRPCDAISREQYYGVAVTQDTHGFVLFGKHVPLCMVIPLTSILQGKNTPVSNQFLLGAFFNYYPQAGSILQDGPNVCIANLINGNCIHYLASNVAIGKLAANNNDASYFQVANSQMSQLGIRIFLDATKGNTTTKALFSEFTFTITDPENTISFGKNKLLSDIKNTVKPAGSSPSHLLIPFSGDSQLSMNILDLPKTSGSCEQTPQTSSNGIPLKEVFQSQGGFIRYQSEAGSSCDHFSYQNLLQDQAYLLIVNARNVAGLPLFLCVTNHYSKRCDIYASLATNSRFTTQTFLIPPMNDNKDGYDINISNLGISGTPAINDLKTIQLVPFPYAWMTQLASGNSSSTAIPTSVLATHYLHPNPSIYIATSLPAATSKQKRVLSLAVSYEAGWRAYTVSGDSFWNRYFPFILGKPLANHVLVNNWENGWEMPQNSGHTTVVIVFLPQYLEYLGFFLLLVTLGYFLPFKWFRHYLTKH